jgi:C4-dicarboxylate-specific signal transduction histidine kinase
MSLKNRFILFLSIILIEKDIKNYQQLQTSILISNLIILVILGIVIYFLIRRLYFKPFENLKDRLTSSNLDNTFLEEKTNRDETAAIISSVASLIRNLRNEKAELLITNEALKQAQDDLIKSEQISTVGKIAASIAHEVCQKLVTGTFPKNTNNINGLHRDPRKK